MSKLLKLKEWLTLTDAAKHLSTAFSEEVSEADVLRFGLEGQLRLSLRFTNSFPVKQVSKTVTDEVERLINAYHSEEISSQAQREYLISLILEQEFSQPIQKFEPTMALGASAWPLVMTRCADVVIERKYQELTTQHYVRPDVGCGLILKDSANHFFQLQKLPELVEIADDEPITDEALGVTLAQDLPVDSHIVIGTDHLIVFEKTHLREDDSLDMASRLKETPQERRKRIVSYVNNSFSSGVTKESAYKELAEIEGCGVENIKRIYKG